MRGRGWCSHWLKALEAYLLRIHSLSLSLFLAIAGKGKSLGTGGGVLRFGHEQVLPPGMRFGFSWGLTDM